MTCLALAACVWLRCPFPLFCDYKPLAVQARPGLLAGKQTKRSNLPEGAMNSLSLLALLPLVGTSSQDPPNSFHLRKSSSLAA